MVFVGSAGSRPFVSLFSCTVIFGVRGLSRRPNGDRGWGAVAAALFRRGGVVGEVSLLADEVSLFTDEVSLPASVATGSLVVQVQLSSHKHAFANAPTNTEGILGPPSVLDPVPGLGAGSDAGGAIRYSSDE